MFFEEFGGIFLTHLSCDPPFISVGPVKKDDIRPVELNSGAVHLAYSVWDQTM